jgi:hypothetical protein
VNTFLWHLELSALGDLDSLNRLVSSSLRYVLNLLYDFVALEDLSENDVAAVEPAGDDGGNEELAAVGVLMVHVRQCMSHIGFIHGDSYLSAVGHAEETLAGVLELEVLVGELGAVDALSACAIA